MPSLAANPPKDVPVYQASDTITSWPAPLAEEAYYGLAGEIVQCIEPQTEASPVALLANFLVFSGSWFGRRPEFYLSATRHGTNLFAMIVGATSKSRKGTATDIIMELFSIANPDSTSPQILSGLQSGEGILQAVRDPVSKTFTDKDGNTRTEIVDQGAAEKRALFVEDEFAIVLQSMGRHGNVLANVMRSAWNGRDLRQTTKNNPLKATGAHISMIGHITEDDLSEYFKGTDMANGFGNRFLWFCVTRSKLLPKAPRIKYPDEMVKRLRQSLSKALSINEGQEFERDPAAQEYWENIYPTLSEGTDGIVGKLTDRNEGQAQRLAMIYAVHDQKDVIELPHLEAAIAVVDYCDASVTHIFGGKMNNQDAVKILTFLKANQADGLTRTDINDLFKGKKLKSEIEAALKIVEDRNLAYRKIENPGANETERWFGVTQSQ